jgi:hypothetical protein
MSPLKCGIDLIFTSIKKFFFYFSENFGTLKFGPAPLPLTNERHKKMDQRVGRIVTEIISYLEESIDRTVDRIIQEKRVGTDYGVLDYMFVPPGDMPEVMRRLNEHLKLTGLIAINRNPNDMRVTIGICRRPLPECEDTTISRAVTRYEDALAQVTN